MGSYMELLGYTGLETNVVVPESISNIKVGTIAENAFYADRMTIELTLPSQLLNIASGAISQCENLETLTISSRTGSVGALLSNAIVDCDKLTKVYIYGTVNTMYLRAINDCPSATIYLSYNSAPAGWDEDWYRNIGTIRWGTL